MLNVRNPYTVSTTASKVVNAKSAFIWFSAFVDISIALQQKLFVSTATTPLAAQILRHIRQIVVPQHLDNGERLRDQEDRCQEGETLLEERGARGDADDYDPEEDRDNRQHEGADGKEHVHLPPVQHFQGGVELLLPLPRVVVPVLRVLVLLRRPVVQKTDPRTLR